MYTGLQVPFSLIRY